MQEHKAKNRGAGFLICALALFGAGCASTDSATSVSYTGPDGTTFHVVFPKELTAEDFKLDLNAREGIARISAKRWKSRSVEVIKAAGEREKANLVATAVLSEKIASGVTEGLAKGAIKGVKGGLP